MATASLLPDPRFVAYDANGNPLCGGLVYVYVPGGTTPATTWQDAAETTPNANPIVLDGNGSALIYGVGNYQITVTDSLGNAVPAYSGLSTPPAAVSEAMLAVVQAATTAAALTALGVSPAMQPVVGAATQVAALQAMGNLGSVTSGAIPISYFNFTEALAMGANVFYDAFVIAQTRTGGTGHRQAFTAQITSSGANSGEMTVGSCGFAFLTGGSSSAFGMNGYAQALSGTAATASVIGAEFNTDVQTPVVGKVGVQVVDVATSINDGTGRSAGIYIARQGGAVGWQAAIQFGDTSAPAAMTPSNINLLYLAGAPGSVPLHRGIDFRAGNFSLPAIDLPVLSSIAFAGGASGLLGLAGTILSATTVNGPVLTFGNASLQVTDVTNTTPAFSVVTTSGAPSVNVYIPTVGLRQITAGATSSGGTGFRMLTVAN